MTSSNLRQARADILDALAYEREQALRPTPLLTLCELRALPREERASTWLALDSATKFGIACSVLEEIGAWFEGDDVARKVAELDRNAQASVERAAAATTPEALAQTADEADSADHNETPSTSTSKPSNTNESETSMTSEPSITTGTRIRVTNPLCVHYHRTGTVGQCDETYIGVRLDPMGNGDTYACDGYASLSTSEVEVIEEVRPETISVDPALVTALRIILETQHPGPQFRKALGTAIEELIEKQTPFSFDPASRILSIASRSEKGVTRRTNGADCTCPGVRHAWHWHVCAWLFIVAYEAISDPYALLSPAALETESARLAA